MSMMNGGLPSVEDRRKVAAWLREMADTIEGKSLDSLTVEHNFDIRLLGMDVTLSPPAANLHGQSFTVKFSHAPEKLA